MLVRSWLLLFGAWHCATLSPCRQATGHAPFTSIDLSPGLTHTCKQASTASQYHKKEPKQEANTRDAGVARIELTHACVRI